MSSEVTVLLMLEAIDKASKIIEGIGGKLEGLGEKAKAAADKAAMTGDELEAAQIKAEAAANAYQAAVEEQAAAQAKLLESTNAVREAQAAAAEAASRLAEADRSVASGVADAATASQGSYAEISAAADSSAAAVKAAVGEQVAALDDLRRAEGRVADRSAEMSAAQDAASTDSAASGLALKGLAVGAGLTAAAVAGIGYESVKAAAKFQSATTVLVTSGGETQANIAQVRQGILDLASSTGTATQELTNGMYMIGSAGFTGAKGLTVLKAAAQGAKAENADLGTVSNALTTVLKDYGMGANQATAAMDQMIAVVQNGKTTTEALAGSLSNVLPVASAAGLSFNQVGGAMATMTGEGMSAQQAAQDLANTIRSLQSPNQVAITEMQQMGLNSNQVSMQLGKKGLTGTLQELTAAITAHMGPAGKVIMSTFQQAKDAAADAETEIKSMPASLQHLAQGFLNGSISSKQWRQDLQGLDPVSAHLMTQFAATAEKAHSFNSLLTSGKPAAQTYTGALSKMLGGATGLNTALMLTGGNMSTFQANVAAVGAAGKSAGSDVNGWAEIQGTMNQKLDELKQTAEVASIELGTALLPVVEKILTEVLKIVTPIARWIEHNRTLAAAILLVVGALATGITVFVMAMKAITMVKEAMTAFSLMTEGLEFNPVIAAVTAIAVIALLIVTHWSTVKKWIKEFWDWLKKTFSEAVSFVKSHVHEIAAGLILLLGPIGLLIAAALEIATHWRQVEHVLKDVWAWMKGAAKDVAGAVSSAFRAAVRFVTGLWKGFVDDLKAAWGLIKDGWDATGGKAVDAIKNAWDEVSAAFDKEWSKISGDLSSIWASLQQIWNATGGALIAGIEQATRDVVGFIEAHWQTIKTIVKAALTPLIVIARETWDMVKLVFTAAFDNIRMIVTTAWKVISGLFTAAWDVIRGIVAVSWDMVKGIFQAAFDVISGLVRAGWDFISGIFKAVFDIIKGIVKAAWYAITTTINIALDLLKGIFKAFADLLTGKWGKLWSDIKSMFSSVWHDIAGFFHSILGDIESTVTGAASSIWHGFIGSIEAALSGIGAALEDVWHAIVRAFDDAGSWLLQAGKDIINGLISGVENMASQAVQAVKNVGSDIVKGAKDILHIFSPSRVFADIGQMTMAGMALGITGAAPTVHAAMRKAMSGVAGPSLTASISTQARMTGSSLGTAVAAGLGGAAGSGGIGGTTIINQFTGNHLMSDADITKFATVVGQKVVTQLGPQGGVKTLLR